ncbi:nitroreductase [Sulfitobacter guttiformis]|uniref:Nitroreductase n=1 Tax=Sulfitobacter guttiformis TaxID=74349 RepID=A0A420DK71_9RHOB|nr:nitroreductase [Sulfitobacter guttiformis]KIN71580.1 Nitroreductase family protein [Sulfitobacter guttiformis KCTC 32187]RKE94585.1 nitroreductase [Sulfitobacter guttiformis]
MSAIETLVEIMSDRYSCRAFLPDPVPDTDLVRIVETARHVPSWCNAQPWQVEITRGAATDRLRDSLQKTVLAGTPPAPDLDWPAKYTGDYAERRRTCGFQLYDAVGIEKSDRAGRAAQMMRNYAFFDAPHVAIIHSPSELGPYGAMDTGGFVAAFTLAATALGVATIPQAAIAAYAPQLKAHLGIGDDRLILCAISLGYADKDAPANSFRTERAEAADILRWHDT